MLFLFQKVTKGWEVSLPTSFPYLPSDFSQRLPISYVSFQEQYILLFCTLEIMVSHHSFNLHYLSDVKRQDNSAPKHKLWNQFVEGHVSAEWFTLCVTCLISYAVSFIKWRWWWYLLQKMKIKWAHICKAQYIIYIK